MAEVYLTLFILIQNFLEGLSFKRAFSCQQEEKDDPCTEDITLRVVVDILIGRSIDDLRGNKPWGSTSFEQILLRIVLGCKSEIDNLLIALIKLPFLNYNYH